MILLFPPSQVQAPGLPTHVHSDLGSTIEGAKTSSRFQIICILPKDETQQEKIHSYLNSIEGAWLRSVAEVWVSPPFSPQAQEIMTLAGLHTRSAVVQMDRDAKHVLGARVVGDDFSLSDACRMLIGGKVADEDSTKERIIAWSSKLDPEVILNFGIARSQNLGAAAKEPFRTMLVGLLSARDLKIRLWGATRLVEANAPHNIGEPDPWKIFIDYKVDYFKAILNFKEPPEFASPWKELGIPGEIDQGAPFWNAYRSFLRSQVPIKVNTATYAVIAPALMQEDHDWVFRAFSAPPGRDAPDPWDNTAFWIGTDWLLTYGKPEDWKVFEENQIDQGWRNALQLVANQVKPIKTYWDSSVAMDNLFCGGVSREDFWRRPDPCLSAWGIDRTNLIEQTIETSNYRTGRNLKLPFIAHTHHYSGEVRIRLMLDANGAPIWARPAPGYALGIFGPDALIKACGAAYEPGKVGGVARPSTFVLRCLYYSR